MTSRWWKIANSEGVGWYWYRTQARFDDMDERDALREEVEHYRAASEGMEEMYVRTMRTRDALLDAGDGLAARSRQRLDGCCGLARRGGHVDCDDCADDRAALAAWDEVAP